MIITIVPLPLEDGVIIWEARMEGQPPTRSFLMDHALGLLVRKRPDLFGIEMKYERLKREAQRG